MNTNTSKKSVGVWIVTMAVALVLGATSMLADVIANLDVNDRVGNGWHMASQVTVNSDGRIFGTTTLKNYNNVKGFTGGLFVVAVDDNMNPIYSTPVHSWGINACFFAKSRTRTATWSETIPAQYLDQIASIAVIQQHTPTNRVWVWIYNNRQLIIDKAQLFLALYQKSQTTALTESDILEAVNAVVAILEQTNSDAWVIQHIGELNTIAQSVYALSKKEDGWVPANAAEAQTLVNKIVTLCDQGLDWNDADAVKALVKETIALVNDKDGWVPANTGDVQEIVEAIYALVKDEPNVPAKVKTAIAAAITALQNAQN